MRPHGSPKVLEERRRRAAMLFKTKLSLYEIACRIGCHASSVLRWRRAARLGGPNALKAKPAPGRPSGLTITQKRGLVKLLLKGAMSHGYRTELWTTLRIAELIHRHYGINYHRNHVGKLLHQLGVEPPETRAPGRRAQ